MNTTQPARPAPDDDADCTLIKQDYSTGPLVDPEQDNIGDVIEEARCLLIPLKKIFDSAQGDVQIDRDETDGFSLLLHCVIRSLNYASALYTRQIGDPAVKAYREGNKCAAEEYRRGVRAGID